MKKISLILATAFSFGITYPAKGDCGWGITTHINVAVLENEALARIWLFRSADTTNLVETVEYFTADGPPGVTPSFPAGIARAGVDYVARSGIARFTVGERATSVDVPVIDNGLLDGVRDFSLVLTNPSLGLPVHLGNIRWIRIEDNEMGSAVDPLFAPDESSRVYGATAFPMPDGRILMSRDGPGLGLIMLQSNGWVDANFSTQLVSNQTGLLVGIQVLNGGTILAKDYAEQPRRILRLLPGGAVDKVFTISNFGGPATAQPDGKILLTGRDGQKLRRLNTDGSLDASFRALMDGWNEIAFQPDGKILLLGGIMLRLNPDGSLDQTFSAPDFGGGFLLRKNGKLIIGDCCGPKAGFVQLNEDGGFDAEFKLDVPPGLPTDEVWRHLPEIVEQSDGQLSMGIDEQFREWMSIGAVMRWNSDGSRGRILALTSGGPAPESCNKPEMTLASAGPHHLFVSGGFNSVDGFPRRGLARLFTNPPERDFRVLTPAEFWRSGSLARVRVVRTGPTTNAAAVSFTTSDGTAAAGVDYAAQTGTLTFAPLEVGKEIMVPLLAGSGVDAHLFFNLELSNPSAGYTNIASTPIVILPDLRIATDSLRPRADGSIAITLRGTVPGRGYSLQSSSDLKDWQWIADAQATGSTVAFDVFRPKTASQFFRARQD